MKHIVTVTISNPSHEHVSLRRRQSTTNYMVEARDEAEAIFRASNHFKKLGNYVHNAVIAEGYMKNTLSDDKDTGEADVAEYERHMAKKPGVKAYDKEGNLVGHYRSMADAKKFKPGHSYKEVKEEVEDLQEGPSTFRYSGYVNDKEYTLDVPAHKDLGDYSDEALHKKLSQQNKHLAHHEVTAIVNSDGQEESHETVEHEGKKYTHEVNNNPEPRHIYEDTRLPPKFYKKIVDKLNKKKAGMKEEVEQIDELNAGKGSILDRATKAARSKFKLSDINVRGTGMSKKTRDAHDRYTDLNFKLNQANAAKRAADASGTKYSDEYVSNIKQGKEWHAAVAKVKADRKAASDAKKAAKLAKEEVEQIDELKKSTLASYITKASRQSSALHSLGKEFDNDKRMYAQKALKARTPKTKEKAKADMETSGRLAKTFTRKAQNRTTGISRAAVRLAKEEVEQVSEVLKPSMGASAYIHDFVHSDNPKFAGKTKAERTKMALGAFYAAKKGK